MWLIFKIFNQIKKFSLNQRKSKMGHTFIIIDDNQDDGEKTQAIAERFRNLSYLASANNYDDGVNLILEHQPHLVFLEIDPSDKKSKLSLSLINELYRYLPLVPKIIITSSKKDLAYDALKYEVIDYLLKPFFHTYYI